MTKYDWCLNYATAILSGKVNDRRYSYSVKKFNACMAIAGLVYDRVQKRLES